MVEVRQTTNYQKWFKSLKDHNARMRINVRIRRLSLGNPGDVKAVGDGISELKIDYGPGYRIYYLTLGNEVIILLVGGDKSTQMNDIRKAKLIAKEIE